MDELAKRETTAMVDPRSGKPRGLEGIERDDVIVPRIAIGQSTSKRVQDGELHAGSLYNTISGEAFARESKPYLEFIPIAFAKSRRLWDRENKDSSTCMSNDAIVSVAGKRCATECPYGAYEWGQDEKGNRLAPACTMYFNYLSLISPYDAMFPVSISMGRTSAKTAKQFNSFLMMTGEDIFSRIYAISTELKENQKGRFHIFKLKAIGRPALDIYKKAEALASRMAGMTYTIHEEGAEGEAGNAGDDPIPF